ncbi:MAG: hypothetical protein ACWGMZ_09535 [Thermoguttaceae bacterium]
MRTKIIAFTLLEVLLALSLSALLIFAVTIAVDLNLRLLDSGRTEVEEAQLAREIFRIMAHDLEGTVFLDPRNVKTLMSGAPVATSASTADDSSDTADSDTAEADRIADLSEASPQSQPGLFGNNAELQIDVSRAPSIQQLIATRQVSDSITPVRLSDVKTVSYYVFGTSAALPAQTSGRTAQSQINEAQRGLYRRELDRVSAVYAAGEGQISQTTDNLVPLAPEVESIEFRYFDGVDWWDSWDSISQSSLPRAVLISLWITRLHQGKTKNLQPLMYRLLVKIPTVPPAASGNSTTSSSPSTQTDSGGSQ